MSQRVPRRFSCPIVCVDVANYFIDLVVKVVCCVDILHKIIEDVVQNCYKGLLQPCSRAIEFLWPIVRVEGNTDTHFHAASFMFS